MATEVLIFVCKNQNQTRNKKQTKNRNLCSLARCNLCRESLLHNFQHIYLLTAPLPPNSSDTVYPTPTVHPVQLYGKLADLATNTAKVVPRQAGKRRHLPHPENVAVAVQDELDAERQLRTRAFGGRSDPLPILHAALVHLR